MGNGSKSRMEIVLKVLIIVGFLSFSSCAGFEGLIPWNPQVESPTKGKKSRIFRTDEYIVYTLEQGDDPAALAARFLGDRSKAWLIEDENEKLTMKEGETIVIPLKDRNKAGLSPDGYQVVPILCYHRFAHKSESSLCMEAQTFDQQMKYLKENRYRVISLAELLNFLKYRKAIPKRSVVITIDDGYVSTYEIAYPVLKKYGFAATLFVYTDFVGSCGRAVTWNQLREMKGRGFEVGSHSVTHADLTLKRGEETEEVYLRRIKEELLVSKRIIDKQLKQETLHIAFPNGRYNQRILAICEQAGYKMGLSVERGGNAFFTDPLRLRRNQILGKDMESFVSRLRTFHDLSLR